MMLNCSIVIMENRGLPEWRDSFASAPVGADRGSARSSPRRRRSSAPHLIFRVSLHTNKKCYKPQKRFIAFWSEWRDSNSRHPGPKPGALPTGPHPEIWIAVLTGVAPYSRFAALSGCKQKQASATPTKQLGHTRRYQKPLYMVCAQNATKRYVVFRRREKNCRQMGCE